MDLELQTPFVKNVYSSKSDIVNVKTDLSWFEGETNITECPNVVWVTNFENLAAVEEQRHLSGSLLLTNFRLRFIPELINDNMRHVITDYDVVLYNIEVIYKIKKKKRKPLLPGFLLKNKIEKVEIVCKSFQNVLFDLSSASEDDSHKLIYLLAEASSSAQSDSIMAQARHPNEDFVNDYNLESYWSGWLHKFGESQYKVVTCNESFHIAESLPKCFVVPSSLSAKDVVDMATRFTNNRFPFWTYTHRPTKTALVRMSYKTQRVEDNIEERIYNSIRQSHPTREYPRLFDLAADFPSIDDVRSAYLNVRQICAYDTTTTATLQNQDAKWLSQLEASRWMDLIGRCLNLAKTVANVMSVKKLSVVLKEHSSNDLTPLISSLVQLMLDDSSRTTSGFQGVIRKEWIAMGFKFVSRSGSRYSTSVNNSQRSPVFLLFLDCVHQMVSLKPASFQFNHHYLATIWHAKCSGYFRDFLFDSPKESYYSSLKCQLDLTGNHYLNGSRLWRWGNTGNNNSPAGTLTRKGELDMGVDGTLMRKSQMDFTVFKKQLKRDENKMYIQSQSMIGPNYLAAMSDVDSYTLKSSRSQLSKFSMVSLNSTKSYSTNSTPFSRKQQLIRTNQQLRNEYTNSPELINMRTLKKSSLSQQRLNVNGQRDDQSEAFYDNPWTDLIGQVSRDGTFQLFDWPVIFDSNDLKFQSVPYMARTIISDVETVESANETKQTLTTQTQKSALILNGQKFYNYSSVYQDVSTTPSFEFASVNFTVPSLRFWTECFLRYHPMGDDFTLVRGSDKKSELTVHSDTFGVFHKLIQSIQNFEKCLANAL